MAKSLINCTFAVRVFKHASQKMHLTLKLAGGGGFVEHPPRFFSLKFLPFEKLPSAFAQLFLDNEEIF